MIVTKVECILHAVYLDACYAYDVHNGVLSEKNNCPQKKTVRIKLSAKTTVRKKNYPQTNCLQKKLSAKNCPQKELSANTTVRKNNCPQKQLSAKELSTKTTVHKNNCPQKYRRSVVAHVTIAYHVIKPHAESVSPHTNYFAPPM